MTEPNAAPHRNPQIEEAPLQAELMLFDPGTGRFFVLNPTMAFLWKHCDGEKCLPDIAEELCVAFDGVGQIRALEDLSRALSELRSLGLVA
jgi:coenzyme PQQ synthesis protein D (PqqD)